MKITLLYVCLLMSLYSNAQQGYYPCYIYVINTKTNQPVAKAYVVIDQIGNDTKQTNTEGKCNFNNVPVGRIEITVIHPGYKKHTIKENITSETKSNSFTLALIPNSESDLIISGKVQDGLGVNLNNVKVEVKIDGKPYDDSTDKGGNYYI